MMRVRVQGLGWLILNRGHLGLQVGSFTMQVANEAYMWLFSLWNFWGDLFINDLGGLYGTI